MKCLVLGGPPGWAREGAPGALGIPRLSPEALGTLLSSGITSRSLTLWFPMGPQQDAEG